MEKEKSIVIKLKQDETGFYFETAFAGFNTLEERLGVLEIIKHNLLNAEISDHNKRHDDENVN